MIEPWLDGFWSAVCQHLGLHGDESTTSSSAVDNTDSAKSEILMNAETSNKTAIGLSNGENANNGTVSDSNQPNEVTSSLSNPEIEKTNNSSVNGENSTNDKVHTADNTLDQDGSSDAGRQKNITPDTRNSQTTQAVDQSEGVASQIPETFLPAIRASIASLKDSTLNLPMCPPRYLHLQYLEETSKVRGLMMIIKGRHLFLISLHRSEKNCLDFVLHFHITGTRDGVY